MSKPTPGSIEANLHFDKFLHDFDSAEAHGHSWWADNMRTSFIEGCNYISMQPLYKTAPDLLEALEAMMSKAYKQNWNDNYPDQLAMAEAAVDKARGES